MKGLILNNLYSVEKGAKSSILIATTTVIILVFTQNDMALRAAIFLPFLLIPVHGFEVLKHDAMSGWKKFEATLPVTRKQIVRSKYCTFLLLFLVSVVLVSVIFMVTHIFAYPVIDTTFFNFLLRGMGLILCLSAYTYTLTYKLGTEKSDSIMIGSMAFTFGIFFGLSIILELIIGNVPYIDEMFSIVFCILAVICLIISYVISVYLYKKEEF